MVSLVGYFLLAIWFPIVPNFDHTPLLDIRSFTPTLWAGAAYGLLLCVLFGIFILAYRQVRRSVQAVGLASILGISVFFALPLILVYPINANDIYRYVIRGRISTVYEQNPFLVAPDAFPDDPFLPLAGEWASETSPYGPIWETIDASVTFLTGDNLLMGLLTFKVLVLLAFSGTTIVLWALFNPFGKNEKSTMAAERRGERAANTMMWAWNPALLLIFMVNGHNDVLMLFWLLLGLFVWRQGFPVPGFLLMVLGALTKPIGVLALPIFFVSALHDRQSLVDRLRFTIFVAAGGLILGVLFFMPFGSPLVLVQRLMREAGQGGAFSPAVLLLLFAQQIGMQLIGGTISRLISLLFMLFTVFGIWLLWRTWLGRSPLRGTADIFFGYLVQALNFRIWYASWPFPWLLLDVTSDPDKPWAARRFQYGFWFLLTSQLSVLIYGHIRVYLLAGSHWYAHLLGVTFTFAGPYFLALFSNKTGLLNPENRVIEA